MMHGEMSRTRKKYFSECGATQFVQTLSCLYPVTHIAVGNILLIPSPAMAELV